MWFTDNATWLWVSCWKSAPACSTEKKKKNTHFGGWCCSERHMYVHVGTCPPTTHPCPPPSVVADRDTEQQHQVMFKWRGLLNELLIENMFFCTKLYVLYMVRWSIHSKGKTTQPILSGTSRMCIEKGYIVAMKRIYSRNKHRVHCQNLMVVFSLLLWVIHIIECFIRQSRIKSVWAKSMLLNIHTNIFTT